MSSEDRKVMCSCGESLPLSHLPEHRLACVPLANELRRRKRVLQPPEWMRQAECRGKDTEEWFVDEASYVTTPIERAMRICARCPVRRECLEYAYTSDHTEEQGIYAGTRGRDRTEAKHREDRIEYLLARQVQEVSARGLVMKGEGEVEVEVA